MAAYNTLHTSLKCPRCGRDVETTVDCYFGYVSEMVELKIGDRYPWADDKMAQNGGRPENGTVDGEGYMECPLCSKDAFVRVLVRDDVIIGVRPNSDKRGYIPD